MTNMHRRTFLAAAGTAVLAPALPLSASSGSSPAPVLLTGYFLQESDDPNQSFESLIAGDEAAINSHNQHHDAEAAGPAATMRSSPGMFSRVVPATGCAPSQ